MMRIGVDGGCWANRRGYGRFTRELLKEVVRLDPNSQYLFFCDPETSAELPFSGKITVELSQNVSQAAAASGYRKPADLLRMTKAVFQEDLDWMFFPSVYSYFPVANACLVGVTIHDTIAELYPHLIFPDSRAQLFWKAKVKASLLQADRVFTVSEYARTCIEKIHGIAREHIIVLPEAPDPFFFSEPAPEEAQRVFSKLSLSDADPFFLYIGGISPHKNLRQLVEVFGDAALQECRLLLIGETEADRFHSDLAVLRSRIERSPAAKRILLTGFLSDGEVLALLKQARALVLPSFSEGYGLPAVEAMAAGAPVIATKHSAIPEIAPGGALFSDPADSSTLLDAMISLHRDSALRAALAENGRQCVLKLSWARTAQILIDSLAQM